jgi:hypothetical protein
MVAAAVPVGLVDTAEFELVAVLGGGGATVSVPASTLTKSSVVGVEMP